MSKENEIITFTDEQMESLGVSAIAITSRPIGDICVGKKIFNPKDDITPVENARITAMFSRFPLSGYWDLDFESYIEKYDLGRHFDEIEEQEN